MGNKETKLKKIFEDIDNNEDNRSQTHKPPIKLAFHKKC